MPNSWCGGSSPTASFWHRLEWHSTIRFVQVQAVCPSRRARLCGWMESSWVRMFRWLCSSPTRLSERGGLYFCTFSAVLADHDIQKQYDDCYAFNWRLVTTIAVGELSSFACLGAVMFQWHWTESISAHSMGLWGNNNLMVRTQSQFHSFG